MDEQVPASQAPQAEPSSFMAPLQMPPGITPEMLEQMKARAREQAVRITMEQRSTIPQQSFAPQSNVVYVRRNLTVAELILVFAISTGLVVGVQSAWYYATNFLPRVEIRVK